jgi:hypothetical protein
MHAVWPLAIASLSFGIGAVFRGSKLNPILTWLLCFTLIAVRRRRTRCAP